MTVKVWKKYEMVWMNNNKSSFIPVNNDERGVM